MKRLVGYACPTVLPKVILVLILLNTETLARAPDESLKGAKKRLTRNWFVVLGCQ